MIVTSREFDKALEAEFDRLFIARLAEYKESQEFYAMLDKAVQVEMTRLAPVVACQSSGETLRLYLAPEDSDANSYVDVEEAIDNDITDGDTEQLQYVLTRLDMLAERVRGALSHNAELAGTG